jgi:hypothetical protein
MFISPSGIGNLQTFLPEQVYRHASDEEAIRNPAGTVRPVPRVQEEQNMSPVYTGSIRRRHVGWNLSVLAYAEVTAGEAWELCNKVMLFLPPEMKCLAHLPHCFLFVPTLLVSLLTLSLSNGITLIANTRFHGVTERRGVSLNVSLQKKKQL